MDTKYEEFLVEGIDCFSHSNFEPALKYAVDAINAVPRKFEAWKLKADAESALNSSVCLESYTVAILLKMQASPNVSLLDHIDHVRTEMIIYLENAAIKSLLKKSVSVTDTSFIELFLETWPDNDEEFKQFFQKFHSEITNETAEIVMNLATQVLIKAGKEPRKVPIKVLCAWLLSGYAYSALKQKFFSLICYLIAMEKSLQCCRNYELNSPAGQFAKEVLICAVTYLQPLPQSFKYSKYIGYDFDLLCFLNILKLEAGNVSFPFATAVVALITAEFRLGHVASSIEHYNRIAPVLHSSVKELLDNKDAIAYLLPLLVECKIQYFINLKNTFSSFWGREGSSKLRSAMQTILKWLPPDDGLSYYYQRKIALNIAEMELDRENSDLNMVEEMLEEAQSLDNVDDEELELMYRMLLAKYEHKMNKWETAEDHFNEAVELLLTQNLHRLGARMYWNIAVFLQENANRKESSQTEVRASTNTEIEQWFEKSVDMAALTFDKIEGAKALLKYGEFALQVGKFEKSKECFEEVHLIWLNALADAYTSRHLETTFGLLAKLSYPTQVLQTIHIYNKDTWKALSIGNSVRGNLSKFRKWKRSNSTIDDITAELSKEEIHDFIQKLNGIFLFYSEAAVKNTFILWALDKDGETIKYLIRDNESENGQTEGKPAADIAELRISRSRIVPCMDYISLYSSIYRHIGISLECIRSSSQNDYGYLLEPIEEVLQKARQSDAKEFSLQHCLICPDGKLYSARFALLTGSDGWNLLQDYTVSLIPSIQDAISLIKLPELKQVCREILIIANPDSAKYKYPSLRYAEEEAAIVERIAKSEFSLHVDSGDILKGKQATKTNIKHKITHTCIVHIAAHASAEHVHESVSKKKFGGGIILTADEKEEEKEEEPDWFLSFQEILEFDLSNVELAVLNCCYTGSGTALYDGIASLGASFLAAGARAVLVSQVMVVDEPEICKMMEHFYRSYLGKGRNAASALRDAMLTMKDEHPTFDSGSFYVMGGLMPGKSNAERKPNEP